MAPLDLIAALWITTLVSAAIKAAVLVALAAAATTSMRRQSAAVKHLIWTTALGATVAVLILPSVLPAWRVIPIPAAAVAAVHSGARSARPASSALGADSFASFESVSAASRPTADVAEPHGTPATLARTVADRWPLALVILWLTGALLTLARHLWSMRVLVRLSGRAASCPDAAGGTIAREIAGDLGVTRPVVVLRSDEVEWPLTWGIVRPRVVLPGDATEWSDERLRYVIQHEIAHIKRLDACTQLVADMASAVFWFHPFVRHAARQMRLERERACDDCVVSHGALASAYAGDLLALVQTYGHLAGHPAALAMARRSQFEGRLLALLDPGVNRAGVSGRQLSLALLLALIVVIPAATLRAAPAAVATLASHPNPEFVAMPHAVPAPSRARAPEVLRRPALVHAAAPTDLFEGCSGPHATHDHVNPTNGVTVWTSSAQSGDCRYELTAHGDVSFTGDLDAIDRISDDGDLDVTTDIRGDVTHLVARQTLAGITFDFSRNGAPVDFAAAGRAWLAAFLLTLDRHTAFAADVRLPRLLRSGGPEAALDEIDRMQTDHVRTVYLVRLIGAGPMDDNAIGRSINAVSGMTSDHDKLDVLLELARTQPLDGARRDAYFNAAATIEAGPQRRRALGAIDHR